MKKVEAIIRTSKFEQVHAELAKIGIGFMSFSEVKGYGMEHGATQTYRGAVYDVGFIPRTKLEIVVIDEKLDELVQCIKDSASTGEVGDGKVFIYDIIDAIRIRNGEHGQNAL